MNFYISATTDIGVKKAVNQDSLLVRKLTTRQGSMVFAVMCDGMGGLKNGEIASSRLTSAFSEWMNRHLPALVNIPLEDYILRREWNDLIREENEAIFRFGKANGYRLGTTATVILITQERYYLLNIGDSRAYLFNVSGLGQLTEDHTLVSREIALGKMTPDQAEHSPVRSILTRCVGVEEIARPDMFFGIPMPGDSFMLCSDGFRHCLTAQELWNTLYRDAILDTSDMGRREALLIDTAKRRGETDNISVITIHCR